MILTNCFEVLLIQFFGLYFVQFYICIHNKLTIKFSMSLSVHTLKNLISQDETPTASTTQQKCKHNLLTKLESTLLSIVVLLI